MSRLADKVNRLARNVKDKAKTMYYIKIQTIAKEIR